MTAIAILHPGEMGSAVGNALIDVGHEVSWLPAERGSDTRARAERAGLRGRSTVRDCGVVISICPPSVAVATARAIGEFTGTYVDANAIAPRTADEVCRIVRDHGAVYVDGGLIGPPPRRAGTTRLYLSGEQAGEIARDFTDSRVDASVLEGPDFAASSLKMAYAAWTKISAGLVLAARGAAAELGVEQALAQEWALSQPGLEDRYQAARADAVAKGWRWGDEMLQIARTFVDVGQPGEFGVAAAQVFSWHPRP
jgi:3-hydroxyisobutyrate dehydrogenase-like beta-hydroxyacid dehydrogenase